MEHLDELNLGSRRQNMGKDHPPVTSPTATDHTASLLDVPQALFNALQQTLAYLGPAVKWEQDPSLSKSHSWDLPLGVPMCTMPPTSALR